MSNIKTYIVARTVVRTVVVQGFKRSLGQVMHSTDFITIWQCPGSSSVHATL
jgi:hypothetical protein